MDAKTILRTIAERFSDGIRIEPIEGGEYLIDFPVWDNMGDPVHLSVGFDGGEAKIDDAGSIAGLLFSLGQHIEGTPAFGLLDDVSRAHGLELDFTEGLVKMSVPEARFYDGVSELLKIVLAFHTVVPHIRVRPGRLKSSGGPRLKSKIKADCRRVSILEHVQTDRRGGRCRQERMASRFPLVSFGRTCST